MSSKNGCKENNKKKKKEDKGKRVKECYVQML